MLGIQAERVDASLATLGPVFPLRSVCGSRDSSVVRARCMVGGARSRAATGGMLAHVRSRLCGAGHVSGPCILSPSPSTLSSMLASRAHTHGSAGVCPVVCPVFASPRLTVSVQNSAQVVGGVFKDMANSAHICHKGYQFCSVVWESTIKWL